MCGPGWAENRKNARHSSEKQFFEGSRLPSRPPTPLPPTLTRGAGLSLLRFRTSFETEIFGFGAQRTRPTRACGHKGHGPISPLSGCGPRPYFGYYGTCTRCFLPSCMSLFILECRGVVLRPSWRAVRCTKIKYFIKMKINHKICTLIFKDREI